MLETPVAFLIFNRPEPTRRVFEAIAQARPPRLLVVADGPRDESEAQRCREARRVVEQVDWPCEVSLEFSDVNLGCKRRVSSGLNWVFEQVPEAIILEDDCLPHPSFFGFCAQLLERFRDDERIMMVSGDNFQGGVQRGAASYYFSRYTHIWGWASWRRAWKYYDVDMTLWPQVRDHDLLPFNTLSERRFWTRLFDSVYAGQVDTWDYQWHFACLAQHGLVVLPQRNLVSNIGFGADATHTHKANSRAALPSCDIGPLRHPALIAVQRDADAYMFRHHFAADARRDAAPLARLRRLLGRGKRALTSNRGSA